MAAQTGQKVFGAGRFYGIPVAEASTPSPFLVAQEITLDFKRDIKRLHGQGQLPVDVAAGMLTVVGKATNGVLAARLFNDLMIAGTLSTGQIPNAAEETLTILAAATSAQLVNGAALVADLGIYGATDGIPLVKASTASVLTVDQYSLSTLGAVGLSSLAARTSLKASYLYSTSGGQTVTMTQQNMGKTGAFQAVMAFVWGTEKLTINLGSCIASDYAFASKLDDYMKPPFGFEAGLQTDGNLGTVSFAELS